MKPNRKKWIESKKRESDRIWRSQFRDINIKLIEDNGIMRTDITFGIPDNRWACRIAKFNT